VSLAAENCRRISKMGVPGKSVAVPFVSAVGRTSNWAYECRLFGRYRLPFNPCVPVRKQKVGARNCSLVRIRNENEVIVQNRKKRGILREISPAVLGSSPTGGAFNTSCYFYRSLLLMKNSLNSTELIMIASTF